jgi:hypothetical protein
MRLDRILLKSVVSSMWCNVKSKCIRSSNQTGRSEIVISDEPIKITNRFAPLLNYSDCSLRSDDTVLYDDGTVARATFRPRNQKKNNLHYMASKRKDQLNQHYFCQAATETDVECEFIHSFIHLFTCQKSFTCSKNRI